MRMGRKRVTGDEAVVISATNTKLPDEMKWLYDEIKAKRTFVTEAAITQVEKEIEERKITHIADICTLFNWVQGKDTKNRNRLATLANIVLLANRGNIDHAALLFSAVKRGLKDDVKEPIDLVLSKKEGRKARKLRKTLEANGTTMAAQLNLPKSSSDKVAARKERARIRKEAKRLGLCTAEYKAQNKKA